MSSDFHRSSDQDGSKNRWIQDTHEYRREAVEVREQIPAPYVRTPPYRVPELVDYYNRMIHKYAAQLRPKFEEDFSDEEGGDMPQAFQLWHRNLASVQVPEDGASIDAGMANVHGEVDVDDVLQKLPRTEKSVSLAQLSNWRDSVITFEIQYRDRREGQQSITRREVLHLPVWAADRCLDQLNRCLDDLGGLPEAAEKDIEVLEPP